MGEFADRWIVKRTPDMTVKAYEAWQAHVNEITGDILGCSVEVHKALGPGLLESAYEPCLCYELKQTKWPVKSQVALPMRYKQIQLDVAYRVDLIVFDLVVVELKCVEKLLPVHEAQLRTYLRLLDLPVGLLINFNVIKLMDGVKRVVNNF
jgi:GxxExxY protein